MEATTTATTATGLWALTSTWDDAETGDTGAWTTIYATRAEAIAHAEEMAQDILAEGNPGETTEEHLQADDPQGPRSTWVWEGTHGSVWTCQVEPLKLGVAYPR